MELTLNQRLQSHPLNILNIPASVMVLLQSFPPAPINLMKTIEMFDYTCRNICMREGLLEAYERKNEMQQNIEGKAVTLVYLDATTRESLMP